MQYNAKETAKASLLSESNVKLAEHVVRQLAKQSRVDSITQERLGAMKALELRKQQLKEEIARIDEILKPVQEHVTDALERGVSPEPGFWGVRILEKNGGVSISYLNLAKDFAKRHDLLSEWDDTRHRALHDAREDARRRKKRILEIE